MAVAMESLPAMAPKAVPTISGGIKIYVMVLRLREALGFRLWALGFGL